jgi:hypothetical protein
MAVTVAMDLERTFAGEAGCGRLAAAARILLTSVSVVLDESYGCIPQSAGPPLNQIVQRAGSNDGAHSIPEISGVYVAVDLEDGIV